MDYLVIYVYVYDRSQTRMFCNYDIKILQQLALKFNTVHTTTILLHIATDHTAQNYRS